VTLGRHSRGTGRPHPFADAVADVAPQTLLARVQREWQATCGAEIARRSQPVSERDGVVTIACSSATWAQELDLMQIDLLQRLNSRLGGPAVATLRFRLSTSSDSFGIYS